MVDEEIDVGGAIVGTSGNVIKHEERKREREREKETCHAIRVCRCQPLHAAPIFELFWHDLQHFLSTIFGTIKIDSAIIVRRKFTRMYVF